ncbi:MAG: TRAP transporter small permease [Clostridia bacterium]|nr:TRAP transporter small permease [Clostridia bacterium]
MNAIKKFLTPVSNVFDKVCSALIVFMLGAMVIITGAQIICRTWFTALSWSDEVTRYLLIWSTFLGATVVYRHNGHISVTLLQDAVSPKLAKTLRVLVHIICFVLFAVLLHYSNLYCLKLKKTATAMPIKMKYIYSCIPVSMAINMVHSLLMIAEEATKEVKG